MAFLPPHGGDLRSFEEQYGCEPIDFSSNTNPLGLSPLAREAVINSLHTADRYPDPKCRRLAKAIADHHGVDASNIVCGNGASDLIWRIAMVSGFKRAMVLAPTFSEYEEALRSQGCELVYHSLYEEKDFVVQDDLIGHIEEELEQGLEALFLCEPNNPTGQISPHAILEEAITCCCEAGVRVIVDECFNGFLDDPQAASVASMLCDYPKLVVLSAHTKIYGMAGLRLGYIISYDAELVELLQSSGPAWPVSSVAQSAGIAALQDLDYVAQSREIIAQERPRIVRALEHAGCKVFPSKANYVLAKTPIANFYELLAKEGILVRSCANYHGLTENFIRVAVRSPKDNDSLIASLDRIANQHKTAVGGGQ